jgi:hypothetical protein
VLPDAPGYVAEFDSASTMVRALASFLHGCDFPRLRAHRMNGPLLRLVSTLPPSMAESVYRLGGWFEAISPKRLAEVDAHDISAWLASVYPRRRYPAVAVGSSNGAALHLCAALGIPWLPQTLLMQLRRTIDVDDTQADLEWGAAHAPELLAANPDIELHHMGDPNQDRLMLPRTAYFRLKRRRLGEPERRFLRGVLEPGGTILVVECTKKWPSVRVDDRHWYQLGGSGGLGADEYLHGGPRVEAFLDERGSARRAWPLSQRTEPAAEAEWGFSDALLDDLVELGAEGRHRVCRIVFCEPEELSGPVADLSRDWYARLGRPAARLVAPCFFLVEPTWTLRTSSVPFWTSFSVEPAARALEAYLDRSPPFDEIYATLFQHGVESIGIADVARWQSLLERARVRSGFLGFSPQRFPRDFTAFVRFHRDLERVAPHFPLPPRLPLQDALHALAATNTVELVTPPSDGADGA